VWECILKQKSRWFYDYVTGFKLFKGNERIVETSESGNQDILVMAQKILK